MKKSKKKTKYPKINNSNINKKKKYKKKIEMNIEKKLLQIQTL